MKRSFGAIYECKKKNIYMSCTKVVLVLSLLLSVNLVLASATDPETCKTKGSQSFFTKAREFFYGPKNSTESYRLVGKLITIPLLSPAAELDYNNIAAPKITYKPRWIYIYTFLSYVDKTSFYVDVNRLMIGICFDEIRKGCRAKSTCLTEPYRPLLKPRTFSEVDGKNDHTVRYTSNVLPFPLDCPEDKPGGESAIANWLQSQERLKQKQNSRIDKNRSLVSALTKAEKGPIKRALQKILCADVIPIIEDYYDEETRNIKIVDDSRDSRPYAVLADKEKVTIAEVEPFGNLYKRRRMKAVAAAAVTTITGAGFVVGHLLKSKKSAHPINVLFLSTALYLSDFRTSY